MINRSMDFVTTRFSWLQVLFRMKDKDTETRFSYTLVISLKKIKMKQKKIS